MTTRQIAESLGKPEKTVRTWASKAAAKSAAMTAKLAASSSAHPADYDLDETLSIIETGMGKNAAAVWRENAGRQIPVHTDDRIGRLETLMAAQIGMVEKLIGAVAEMPRMLSRVALPAPVIQDYFSIIGYAHKLGVPVTFSEAKTIGKEAARLSRDINMEIRKVDDERFGLVNSYHVSVLQEVFKP
jgi:hypothetical protein